MLHDLHAALRSLRHSPIFTLIVVLTLAVGIGATTALFTVVNAVLLRPLPFNDPARLVSVSEADPVSRADSRQAPEPDVVGWRGARSLQSIAAYGNTGAVLTGAGEPTALMGAASNASFFHVLDVAPLLGRFYTTMEEKSGADQVVVLSYALWRDRFHGDTGVIGTAVALDGKPFTAIGVAPPALDFPHGAQFWRPRAYGNSTPDAVFYAAVIGRLAPGVSLTAARAELQALVRQTDATRPVDERGQVVVAVTLHDRLVGATRPALLMLLGAVGALLLIACGNVANLQLTRALVRRRDFAVRVALGASRWRLARQLLAEGLLLSAAGGAFGMLIPVWAVAAVVHISPASVANVDAIHVNLGVLLFAAALSVLTGVLFSLVPMWITTRSDLSTPMSEGGGRSGAAGARQPLRGVLVAAEIGMALVLLTGAGLLTRSLGSVLSIDPGFAAEHAVTAEIFRRRSASPDAESSNRFFASVMEQVRAIPGVEAVAASDAMPLRGFAMSAQVKRAGDGAAVPGVAFTHVTNEYFSVLRIAVLQGRVFDAADQPGAPTAAVLNVTAAHRLFPGGSAIGQSFTLPGSAAARATVVGVVKDVHQRALEADADPQVYLSVAQTPGFLFAIAVRTASGTGNIDRALRRAVLAVDPLQPIQRVETLQSQIDSAVGPRRFNSLIVDIFALVALFLAAVGLYGVMAFQVTQRFAEIGLRMALGASARSILSMILGRGLRLTLGGIVLGIVLSFALTRLLAGLLYGVGTLDAITFAGAPLLLLAAAAVACVVPAWRAARVDPVEAMRR